MGLHVVLHEPEIPANTGNIARTCLATNTALHLIHPLGFSIDDKQVKRAGLDYWKHVNINEYDSIEQLYKIYPDGIFYFIENFGTTYYTERDYASDSDREVFFIFGKETKGIPRDIIKDEEENCLRIPMNDDKVRSLNLSNSVAIVLFEALRQQSFNHLT
ncbi:MAG TPA: tRNA (cytidine(34)-2'-O)-methyltransferase [Pseudogracilibacillus sp.]|nr:tRNA (cytidine(34)-2'-O)-methyltransferase [Pseudogracilibacillus sp.]